MRKQSGFSLIELLIVVVIILVIAAIAIPSLLKSRIAANEASAVGSLRTLVTSEMAYATSRPDTGFTDLAGLRAAGWIDSLLGGGRKSGYTITAVAANGGGSAEGQKDTFFVEAHPNSVGATGLRSFCAVEDRALKYDQTGTTFSRASCLSSTKLMQ
jgi:prepilin-type N-terminal cleavage/methylation domain-containing protein